MAKTKPLRYGGHSATFKIDGEIVDIKYGDELPVGLPDTVIANLRAGDSILEDEPQVEEDSAPDAEELAALSDEEFASVIAEAKVDDLKAAVDGNEALTERLVEAEKARGDKARKSIVALGD